MWMLRFCWGCADKPKDYAGAPILALQTFVGNLAQSGWVSDTARTRKIAGYAGLHPKDIRYFDEQPFYPMSFEDSEVYGSEGSSALDQKLFGQVRSIWAYFYRQQETSEWIADGVIEQWEFDNASLATQAMQQLMPIGDQVYFNTTPYFCCVQQYLIIFHTRANAFSGTQKPVFERFVRESGAVAE